MDKAHLYIITHRETGNRWLVAAENAQAACQKLGLLIGDCHVRETAGDNWRIE